MSPASKFEKMEFPWFKELQAAEIGDLQQLISSLRSKKRLDDHDMTWWRPMLIELLEERAKRIRPPTPTLLAALWVLQQQRRFPKRIEKDAWISAAAKNYGAKENAVANLLNRPKKDRRWRGLRLPKAAKTGR